MTYLVGLSSKDVNTLTKSTSLVPIRDSVRCSSCKELLFNRLEHMIQKHPGIVAVHIMTSYGRLLKQYARTIKP